MNLITYQTVNGEVIRSLLAYPSKNDALSAFYYTMSSALANENLSKIVCLLQDDEGHTVKYEKAEKAVSIPVIEDNPTEEE